MRNSTGVSKKSGYSEVLAPSTEHNHFFTMRYFTINKIVNVIAAILFVIMGIFLIVGFVLNLSIVDELQQASNFDNWKYFILLSGIVAIITAVIFGFGAWKVLSG